MSDTVLDMPKPKKPTGGGARKPKGAKKPFPSREKVKYAGLPKAYWDILQSMTEEGEKYERRSVAFLATLAVRAFLQAEGKVDTKGKPIIPPPEAE